ncbi:hypothetical protein ONZ45_g11570 [Pleurotus djamor]|nr:hypothetical protein ONZ45_g11570 [Pleurotus djamor]
MVPTDVWLEIIELADDRRSLRELLLVSKEINIIVEPFFLRDVSLVAWVQPHTNLGSFYDYATCRRAEPSVVLTEPKYLKDEHENCTVAKRRQLAVKSLSVVFKITHDEGDIVVLSVLLRLLRNLESLSLKFAHFMLETHSQINLFRPPCHPSDTLLLRKLRYLTLNNPSFQTGKFDPFAHELPRLEHIECHGFRFSHATPVAAYSNLKSYSGGRILSFFRLPFLSPPALTHLRLTLGEGQPPHIPTLHTLSCQRINHATIGQLRPILLSAPNLKCLELYDEWTLSDVWAEVIDLLSELNIKVTHIRVKISTGLKTFWNRDKVKKIFNSKSCPDSLKCIELQHTSSTVAVRWYKGIDTAMFVDWKWVTKSPQGRVWLTDWERDCLIVDGTDDSRTTRLLR